ncbi:MAG TPA: hypothetical protein VHQ65_13185, partial [Thermoanaerobaculia bacterium]|nr:hypothetical protein [Thermoanaerobaculia bacterium]
AWRPAAAAMLLVAGFAAAATEVPGYQEHKYAHDLLLQWLERAEPDGTVIAYAGSNKPYPLFGPRLQHRVEMVPAGGDPGRRWFTWDDDGAMAFLDGRGRGWYRNLGLLGVEYVVLVGEAGREGAWVRAQPHRYRRVTFHGPHELWRVLPSDPRDAVQRRRGRSGRSG